ncbi:hypothetical protein [Anaeromyxobacter diazotrophicus]|uniref:Uncharacterized protein n=1 Tax=Anaeromyxobacter diazotrophicus TaxID=2590199 RepID=A0A7I9VTG4_9BACT|nr:hypothetical protein [Anaeromyxobacter diazotrophicus]GEJ59538.1 hypothetical protein AMYX_42790 [Anaeromyxobacter diazotrophicus]
MLTALVSAVAILALAGAAAAGAWWARREAEIELRALRGRLRELTARLATLEQGSAGSGRVGGSAPALRAQARPEEPAASEPGHGPRTVH